MTDSEGKALQAKDKQEVASRAEHTHAGLVFTPDVDIFETDQALTLLADIPGVNTENLDIDLRDNTLTLTGGVDNPAADGEEILLSEYETGKYIRQFTLSEMIDQSKIDAQLTNGVLRLTLPKVEKATPKKIVVKTN